MLTGIRNIFSFCLEKGKMWVCIGRIAYKDLLVFSLSFSMDTSLLGVGFGNALCIYAPETLHLKCVLSAPSGIDGSTNKLHIRLPARTNVDPNVLSQKRTAFMEKKKALTALVKKFLENNDNSLIKTISEKPHKRSRESESNISHAGTTIKLEKSFHQLTAEEQKMVFNRVMSLNLLNLFQKISILDRFNLHCSSPLAKESRFRRYIEANRVQAYEDTLFNRSKLMNHRTKYNSSLKLHQYKLRRRKAADLNRTVQRLIRFTIDQRSTAHTNGRADSEKTPKPDPVPEATYDEATPLTPIKCSTQIKHVEFCSGEFSHLVIACTENRILIWNLLTLRLKSSLKLSVDRIVVDQYTSLVSAFTKANELFVFLPNTPLPLYQRSHLPKIFGAAWIPRRHPKPHSLTVNWQAITELYLLSEEQVRLQHASIFLNIHHTYKYRYHLIVPRNSCDWSHRTIWNLWMHTQPIWVNHCSPFQTRHSPHWWPVKRTTNQQLLFKIHDPQMPTQ